MLVRATRIECLLEQGDAVFMPQPATKDDGAVDCGGHDGPGDRLRDVVVLDEVVGRDLEVNLKAGVGCLEQGRVMLDGQFVDAL